MDTSRKGTIVRTACLLALTSIALTTGCGSRAAPGSNNDPEQSVLRLYQVPSGIAEDVRSVLRSVLSRGDMPDLGSVSVAPGGHLMVLAPAGLQTGVEELVQRVTESSSAGGAPELQFTYWFVLAQPRTTGARGDTADIPELEETLGAISAELGPLDFTLLERVQLGSRSGSEASIRGAFVQIEQYASFTNDGIVAFLNLNAAGPHSLESEVRMNPDELVVLAQSNVQLPPQIGRLLGNSSDAGQMLFYIVKASVVG